MGRQSSKSSAHVTEFLGETGGILLHFRRTTTRQVFKDETVVFKTYFVPLACYRAVFSKRSKLSCSTYDLARAENIAAFQFLQTPPFYYTVAMVSLHEPAKVRDTRRRFSALSRGTETNLSRTQTLRVTTRMLCLWVTGNRGEIRHIIHVVSYVRFVPNFTSMTESK